MSAGDGRPVGAAAAPGTAAGPRPAGPQPADRAHPTTYLDPTTLPFPFCPGCGHGTILEALDRALVRRGVDPTRLVIVSDIGCSGLSDRHFASHALHGLHGRSVTYATGIKLADPGLEVVVLMGDGGCGIGGHHLVSAARRNIGVTVVVFDNLNYGMTGGQHSATTPPGAFTASTPLGQLERPMDICGTVLVNGATWVARTTTFHDDLEDLLAGALENDGFSLVDVWELCTAYYASTNRLGRKGMEELLRELDLPTGLLRRAPRPEHARAWRRHHAVLQGQEALPPRPLPVGFAGSLDRPAAWLLAGGAGKRIGSAASALAVGAVRSGLWAAQRSDYPVTVRTGHSVSEVVVSPERVTPASSAATAVVLDLFAEGHAAAARRLAGLTADARVYRAPDIPEVGSPARQRVLDFPSVPGYQRRKDRWALMGVAVALRDTGTYPVEALLEGLGPEERGAVEAALAAFPPEDGA